MILANYKIEGDCWISEISTDRDGYPRATHKINGERRLNRMQYKRFHPELLPTDVVRHTCHNRACINPEHLIIGTPKDNVQDRIDAGIPSGLMKVSPEEVEDILGLWSLNWSGPKIAKLYGISTNTVYYIVKGKRRDIKY